jgi:hypothetical protein
VSYKYSHIENPLLGMSSMSLSMKSSSMHQTVNWQQALQTWGRMAMVPAIATASWGLPAIVAPQSSPLAAQAADLCRLTTTNTSRFNSSGSVTLGKIPAEIPVILVSPPSGSSSLAEVKYPREYAGFVPVAALGSCAAGGPVVPPVTTTPTSACRRVIAKVYPGVPIKLRAKPLIPEDPQSNIVGTVNEGAFVYVVTDGKTVQSVKDSTYTWIQIDVKQTRTVGNAPRLFSISSATDPTTVWMFNTDAALPGLGNLGVCPP